MGIWNDFDPLNIVVIAATVDLARKTAQELAMSEDVAPEYPGPILHYREDRKIQLPDRTILWYGCASEPRGAWFGMDRDAARHPRCDQIFLHRLCLEDWILEDLLRDSDVPDMWKIQFVD